MSLKRLFIAVDPDLPWRSRHINSSRYDESIVSWTPFILLVALNILGVNTCRRIDKFNRVIDCPMLRDRRKLLHPSVCSPFITPNDGTRSNVLLYDGEKSGRIPTWYHLHHSESWCCACINKPKNPLLRARRPSTMTLIGKTTMALYLLL